MKLPTVILFAGALGLSQAALAQKVWNANGNFDINNRISGMYSGIGGQLGTLLKGCEDNANCTVTIQANAGVHISASDNNQHFTVLFAGAQYGACHVYPQNPAARDKALRGANCYDAVTHQATYYKLNR